MNEFIGKWRNFITDSNRISENLEIGDTVVMKGDEREGRELTIIDKRTMFGSNLQAFTVQDENGMGRSEYDETQLVKIGGVEDRAARSAQFNDGNEFEDEHLDTDGVLDGVIDEELFTPNEMSAKSVEDENLAEGKELDVVETDNRDSTYTILRLSNGDYVEVNVIELYQNLIDNQSDDENLAEIKSLNESAPGYNTRKFGHPLPTLESIQAAHEAKGRIHLSENASLDVDVNTEEDEVEVTYNGESYKSALGDELLFIHYFGDGEYHSENDAPEIFKYLKGKGGELEVDDDEATLTIKMSNLEDGEVNTIKEVRGPIEKIELHIKKGESVDDLDQYGFETNVDDEPIEDLFDENGLSLRDMSIIYDQRGDMYLMDTEDITKYH